MGFVIFGALLFIGGERKLGGVVFGAGLLLGASVFLYRDVPPPDPVLTEALDRGIKLRKTDRAAADKIIEDALVDSQRREEQELAELRARAPADPSAARELGSRLRFRLAMSDKSRRKWEGRFAESPGGQAMLERMTQDRADLERRLAEVEQLLGESSK